MMLTNSPWHPSSVHPVLPEDEVHVWRASLNRPAAEYATLLSTDEQVKAKRYRSEQVQRRFIVGRGILRIILGRYLNSSPEKLQFEYRSHGKPALVAESPGQELCFNLSHSNEMALLAITYNHEVGIDLEYFRPIPNAGELVEQFFSPSERSELDTLPSNRKLGSFFCGWTRKEAYLKARGEGMTYPLDQFSVAMDCDKPAKLLDVKDDPRELSRWSFYTLSPAPGYIGALAVEGHNRHLAQWQLE